MNPLPTTQTDSEIAKLSTPSDRRLTIYRVTIAVLWTLVILILCWIPRTVMKVVEEDTTWFQIPNLDKVVHLGDLRRLRNPLAPGRVFTAAVSLGDSRRPRAGGRERTRPGTSDDRAGCDPGRRRDRFHRRLDRPGTGPGVRAPARFGSSRGSSGRHPREASGTGLLVELMGLAHAVVFSGRRYPMTRRMGRTIRTSMLAFCIVRLVHLGSRGR